MSKRAKEKAIEDYYGNIPDDADKVKAARHFYEQAEKDIALTWEDVKQIAMISIELSRKRFDDFYVHQTISDEEHFSEVLKRFNEHRNGERNNG